MASQARQRRGACFLVVFPASRHPRPQRIVEGVGHVAAADLSRHDQPNRHPEVEVEQPPVEARVAQERSRR